jgi:ubiquinone/menaquinone biosynthesis C-methylase UbiE
MLLGGKVLEVGTGVGFLLPGLAAMADISCSSDLSPVVSYGRALLQQCSLRNVSLVNADMLKLPFPECSFQSAVCLSVIEHVPSPEMATAELARVLQANGCCYPRLST